MKADIEAKEGYLDDKGFHILNDGSFYDRHRYYFDENGYDEFGGFYDEDYDAYNPGEGHEEEYYSWQEQFN